MTLAALEATLALYRYPEQLAARLPTLRLLTRPLAEIEALAKRVAPALVRAIGAGFVVTQGAVHSQIGSGSLPVDVLPSAGLFVRHRREGKRGGRQLNAVAAALRALPEPVIGRIADDALVLDLRTLTDEAAFVAQLAQFSFPSVAS
jgi:L-seryl-tRNA(Ser) seleniumtransferase